MKGSAATDDEILVSQALLDLNNLMSLSESLSTCNWRCRKRRSCLEAPKSAAGGVVDKTATSAASPNTPLSFSPSESDDKPKHSSNKKSRKTYVEMIQELTQHRNILKGEMENVESHYLKLKAIRQEVVRDPQVWRMNSGVELPQHYRVDMVRHYPPLIEDPTMQRYRHPFGPVTAHLHLSGFGPVNLLGIDLNIPAYGVDASPPLDVNGDKRARFAEARRKRKGIIKVKAMRNR